MNPARDSRRSVGRDLSPLVLERSFRIVPRSRVLNSVPTLDSARKRPRLALFWIWMACKRIGRGPAVSFVKAAERPAESRKSDTSLFERVGPMHLVYASKQGYTFLLVNNQYQYPNDASSGAKHLVVKVDARSCLSSSTTCCIFCTPCFKEQSQVFGICTASTSTLFSSEKLTGPIRQGDTARQVVFDVGFCSSKIPIARTSRSTELQANVSPFQKRHMLS